MPFSRPTLSELIQRIESDILSRVEAGIGILRRSYSRVQARVFGGAVNLTFGFIDWLSKQLFVTTATEENLDEHALKWGKTRRQPTFSEGNAGVTGENGKQIPASTIYNNADGDEYETKVLVTISGGVGVIEVKSKETGADKNLDADEILTLANPINGIDDQAIVDSDAIKGGSDLESDNDLRKRVLQRIQNEATGGNDDDYEQWALDTPSLDVTRAWVFGNFTGPGTVGIFFVLDNQTPIFPNSANIAAVQVVIDEHAPAASTPTVYSPIERKISIEMTVSPDTSEVQNNVKDSLVAFFKENTDVGMVLFKSQLDETISVAAGEVDHTITGLEVDGSPRAVGNLSFANNELPTIDPADITFN